MKKIDLGQTISILANLGVITGIIFLAVEIQQNTESLETTMRFNQNERQTEVLEELFRSPHLAAAVTKAVNEEELTREEDLMISVLAMRVFQSWGWQFDELQRGNVRPCQLSVGAKSLTSTLSQTLTSRCSLAIGIGLEEQCLLSFANGWTTTSSVPARLNDGLWPKIDFRLAKFSGKLTPESGRSRDMA